MLTAIDQIANRNHLQVIKSVIPYLPPSEQRMIACYIKMLELNNVARFFRHQPCQLQSCATDRAPVHLPDMLNDIRNYCDENEQKMIDQMTNLITAMEMYSVMAETMMSESENNEECK